jgi:Methyltransferase domain
MLSLETSISSMPNPWLELPLEDYEGHMNSPEVQQLGVLSELFREGLALRAPASVAILGIAGGNGLQHIDPQITKRVVGFDVNPEYLDTVRQRYAHLAALELHCVDLAVQRIDQAPVDLAHAALVFEHAGVECCLQNALSLVAEGGALSVLVQLPSLSEAAVRQVRFPRCRALSPTSR